MIPKKWYFGSEFQSLSDHPNNFPFLNRKFKKEQHYNYGFKSNKQLEVYMDTQVLPY